ncbi:MAG: hypothetical protein IPH51_12725 [Rubrivivax sp.]|nr:hypothetical protein [Rubrivivax sp.]
MLDPILARGDLFAETKQLRGVHVIERDHFVAPWQAYRGLTELRMQVLWRRVRKLRSR